MEIRKYQATVRINSNFFHIFWRNDCIFDLVQWFGVFKTTSYKISKTKLWLLPNISDERSSRSISKILRLNLVTGTLWNGTLWKWSRQLEGRRAKQEQSNIFKNIAIMFPVKILYHIGKNVLLFLTFCTWQLSKNLSDCSHTNIFV